MGQLHAANACKWQGSCEKVIGWNGFTFEQRRPGWHGHVLLRMCPVPVTCPRTARQHGPRHNRRNFNRPWGDAFRVLHLINVSSYLSPYLLSYYHHAIIISSYISIYTYLHIIFIISISSVSFQHSVASTQLNHSTSRPSSVSAGGGPAKAVVWLCSSRCHRKRWSLHVVTVCFCRCDSLCCNIVVIQNVHIIYYT